VKVWPAVFVLTVVVLGTGIALIGGCGNRDDVDRAAYLSENRELLARVPLFPGARRVSVRHEATRYVYDDCPILCDSYIDGYITHVTFKSPPGTTAAEITRFFERQLTPVGWRRAHWGTYPAGWPDRTTGKPYVTNVGFKSGDAGLSINLMPFIQGNTIIRGGRFIVNINHEGYRSRR
jgi:hypothetical protein